MRVDFAGGWLDVPRLARPGAFIVNCAISPLVSIREWTYERNAGLGGSGAWALLMGLDGTQSELDLGVGWQDPAIVAETGLVAWHSGARPALDVKSSGAFLQGKMAIFWSGLQHDTPSMVGHSRDYDAIERAGATARQGVWASDISLIADAVRQSYAVQLGEGMKPLPSDVAGAVAWKYCGGGHGGYAVFLFSTEESRDAAVASRPDFRAVEPFVSSR